MSEVLVEVAGWTILNFLWQGALIGSVFGIVLVLVPRRPQLRYLAGCLALLTMLGAVAMTSAFRYADLSKVESMEEAAVTEAVIETHAPLVFSQCLPCHSTPVIGGNSVGSWSPAALCPSGTTGLVTSGDLEIADTPIPPVEEGSGTKKPETDFLFFDWMAGIWVLGVTLLTFRFFVSWGAAQRLRCRRNVEAPLPLRQGLQRLANQVGVVRPVRLLISASATVPSMIGWLRPVILLPVATVAGLSRAQLEAVLVHELAHVRRHDFLINLLQNVIEIILFFHPVVWWVSKKIREEREFCCDDIAARATGNSIDYARALATLEEQRVGRMTFEVAANGGPLQARIRRLCGLEKPRPFSYATFPLAFLFLSALIPFALVRSEEPTNEKPAGVKVEARALTSGDAVAGFRHLLKKDPEPQIMFRDFVTLAGALEKKDIVVLLDEIGLKRRDGYWPWARSAIYAELAGRDLDAALHHYRNHYGGYSGVREHVPHAIYVGSRPKDPWKALAYLRSIPDDPRFRLTQKASGFNGPMVYANADWYVLSYQRLFQKLAAIDPGRAWRELPGNSEASEKPLDHNQLANAYYPYRGMIEGFFSGLKDDQTFRRYFEKYGLIRGPYTDLIAIPIVKAWMNHDISAALAWAPPQRVPTAENGSIMSGGVDEHATVAWARENPKVALQAIRDGMIPKWRRSLVGVILQSDPSLVGQVLSNDGFSSKIVSPLCRAMTSNSELQERDAFPEPGRKNRPLDYRARYDFFQAAIASDVFSDKEKEKLQGHLEASFAKILNLTTPQSSRK